VSARCEAAGFEPLVAVVPPPLISDVRFHLPVLSRVLTNADPASGPLRSLQLALDVLPPEAAGVLMVMGDFALVQEGTYRALSEAVRTDATRLWRPVHQGRHGHPVWFPAALFDALLDAPIDEGARSVVYAHAEIWGTVRVDDPWIHRDLDEPKDLVVFREEVARGR
jgi:CTP:molybdopterin cytidylyltransferase MocA